VFTSGCNWLQQGRLTTTKEQLELFERVKSHTRFCMNEAQTLRIKVKHMHQLPRPSPRPHTARTDATPSRSKPPALGAKHLPPQILAERPGTVPLPADGSTPRRRQSRGLPSALPQADESLLNMEPVALLEAKPVSSAAAVFEAREASVVAERRLRKSSRALSQAPGLAVAAAHV
jgi:hypothetical protein